MSELKAHTMNRPESTKGKPAPARKKARKAAIPGSMLRLLEDLEMGLAGFDHKGRLIAANSSFYARISASGLVGDVSPAKVRKMLKEADIRQDFPILLDPPQKVTARNGQAYKLLLTHHEKGPLAWSLQIQRPFSLEPEAGAEIPQLRLFPENQDDSGEDLLRQFAHETRTLMTNMQGFSEMMLSERRVMEQAPQFAEWTGFVHDSAATMLAELSEMLELVQILRDDAAFEPQKVRLADVLKDLFGEDADTGGADSGGPFIRCEKTWLRKALRGLAKNLATGSCEQQVRASMKVQDGAVHVLLTRPGENAGDGPSRTPDQERHKAVQPLGIFALPLARAIITRHGGILRYDEKPGGAAEYEVELPVI